MGEEVFDKLLGNVEGVGVGTPDDRRGGTAQFPGSVWQRPHVGGPEGVIEQRACTRCDQLQWQSSDATAVFQSTERRCSRFW
jgi:hypothetical protein